MFNSNTQGTRTVVGDSALALHLRQVFNYMTGGLALSAAVSYFTLTSPALLQLANQSGWLFMIVWIGFAFFSNKIISSVQPKAGLGIFIGFSALTGFSLSSMLAVYTASSIFTAFVVAASMFAAASLYGYTTKKSMAGMMPIIGMASVGLLVAMVANIFIGSSGMSFWISVGVVPLVAIGTAVEMNMIKENFASVMGDAVLESRMAIVSAASFYMSFVVMFIHILNLLGNRE